MTLILTLHGLLKSISETTRTRTIKMEKIPPKRKFKPIDCLSSEELNNLDKEDLVERIRQLEAHNTQLRNIISKSHVTDDTKCPERKRPFDFNNTYFRRVLLRIMYFGWQYQGLAVQENSPHTIEHHLFNALTRTCLIESRDKSGYHRAGRTDKGVSAFGQVISISLRSKYPKDEQNIKENIDNEIPYCAILNKLLPEDIRAVCWMPIPDDKVDYSARFDCKKRQYKYYFPKSNLDISAMNDACKLLVGHFDFRNLCKMDVGNGVTEFYRHIFRAEIVSCDLFDGATAMCYLLIEGNAFLWHQIRCIFGVLLLIGEGKEKPDIIRELLNVDAHPRKPQYSMALDVPLNLYECSYELERDNEWVYCKSELSSLIAHLQGYWTLQSVKTTMIKDCLESLEKVYELQTSVKGTDDTTDNVIEKDRVFHYAECLMQGVKSRIYKPLLERDTCSSLEERITYYKRRRKTPDSETSNMDTE